MLQTANKYDINKYFDGTDLKILPFSYQACKKCYEFSSELLDLI